MDDLLEKIGFAFVVICILVAALAILVGIAFSPRAVPDLADTPYERGRRAARHRIDADGNPYQRSSIAALEWLDGYIDETASSKWFKIQQQLDDAVEGGAAVPITVPADGDLRLRFEDERPVLPVPEPVEPGKIPPAA